MIAEAGLLGAGAAFYAALGRPLVEDTPARGPADAAADMLAEQVRTDTDMLDLALQAARHAPSAEQAQDLARAGHAALLASVGTRQAQLRAVAGVARGWGRTARPRLLTWRLRLLALPLPALPLRWRLRLLARGYAALVGLLGAAALRGDWLALERLRLDLAAWSGAMLDAVRVALRAIEAGRRQE